LAGTAGIAVDHVAHAVELAVDRLDAPEAATRQSGDALVGSGRCRIELSLGKLLGIDHD